MTNKTVTYISTVMKLIKVGATWRMGLMATGKLAFMNAFITKIMMSLIRKMQRTTLYNLKQSC